MNEARPAGGLTGAVVFLTRVPLRVRGRVDLGASVPWFGIVGAVIGLAVGLVGAGLAEVVSPTAAAAVAVLAGVALTGALHEDGLADVADAFAGGWTVEDRLRILDDPRHGTYGVVALCGSIVVRVVAVAALLGHGGEMAVAGCVAAHALGRSAAVTLLATMRPARTEGLGADYSRAVSPGGAAIGVAGGLVLSAAAIGPWIVAGAAVAAVAAAIVAALARGKIGGVSGDVLGAAEQVVEAAVLVTMTGCALRWGLWWT